MKGARPLSNDEILLVSEQFSGTYAIRNRSLFLLGVSVGGRISELLALTIGDVWQNHQPVSDLLFEKGIVKGKETARMIPVNADGMKAIRDLISWHREQYSTLDPERPLFSGEHGKGKVATTRHRGHVVLKEAFERAGLKGAVSTHSMRKTFANRIWRNTLDLDLFQELMGHKTAGGLNAYVLPPPYALARRTTDAIVVFKGVHNGA